MLTLKTTPRPRRRWLSAAFLAAALLASGAITKSARAQSDSDLRKQNQTLTTKVKDLEAELDAARKQIDALTKRSAALETQLASARAAAGSGGIPPLAEEKVTIDESKANASPRALFNAFTESYKKAVADTPMGSDQSGDKDRIIYMRKLDRWKPIAEREYRMPIEWVVRLESGSVADGRVVFVAVDPVTNVRLGDSFDAMLSRAVASRMGELMPRNESGLWELKGTVVPVVALNPQREGRGAFDNPRLIGPFAEYAFTVEPSSVTPHKPAAATQPAANKPAGAATATTKPAATPIEPSK